MEGDAYAALKQGQQRGPVSNSMHHGGDFGRYMELKNQKLGEQYAEKQKRTASTRKQLSNIFAGIAIHVNGFTNPSHQVR